MKERNVTQEFSSPSASIFHNVSNLLLRKLVGNKLLIIMSRLINSELYIPSFANTSLVNANNTRLSTNRNLLLPKVRATYG